MDKKVVHKRKTCYSCNKEKSIYSFFKSNYSKDGRKYECKLCEREMSRRHRAKVGKEYVALRAYKSNLKNRFGITWEEYQNMSSLQNSVCAICKNPSTDKRNSRLAVDHDHKTGEIRGLLCGNCNNGLGKFKDNISYLNEAINYLSKFNGQKDWGDSEGRVETNRTESTVEISKN